MNNAEKYLVALEVDGADVRVATSPTWPSAVKRQPFKYDHPIVSQLLDDAKIDHYLSSLRSDSKISGSGNDGSLAIEFAGLGRRWTADKHPLILCEFLAYKSGLAYRSPRDIRRDLLSLDQRGRRYSKEIEQYAFFDSSARFGDTQAFAFVHHRTGYIIFRGTSSVTDIIHDLRDELTTESYASLPTVPQTLVGSPRPARHTGFAMAWGSIAQEIDGWVREQLRQGHMDKIVLSGHSLGGALAILGAYEFARQNVCPIEAVITFGAPMVGGAEFKTEYESSRLGLKDRTLRVESAEDVVVFISKRAGSYEHVGHVWRFKKRPLRPTWQMVLFSPLIEAEKVSRKKAQRLQRKVDAKAEAHEKRTAISRSGSNSQAGRPPRTWRQFYIQMAIKLLWFIIGIVVRAVAAHSVERRYGLYLSTLSYRKIRAHHLDHANLMLLTRRGQENERILMEKAFRDAKADLALHLGAIRGRHPRTFRHLRKRPIRVDTPTQLEKLEKQYANYIA
jgi:pimeloyl-ACP methyl ester carboxylesterase